MKKISLFLIGALVFGTVAFGGIAPSRAYASSCISISHDLTYGSTDASTGGDVSQLQRFLINQNLLSTTSIIAGTYDSATASAVTSYQSSHGLQATGVVDATTRSSIVQLSCSGSTSTTYLNDGGCSLGYTYNTLTGQPCSTYYQNQSTTVVGCLPGYVYNTLTGQPCSTYYQNQSQTIPGCSSGYAFSTITGQSCYTNGTTYYNPTVPASNITISAPTRLAVGALGTWTVTVTNQNGYGYGSNYYGPVSVRWGDVSTYYNNSTQGVPSASSQSQQVTTFTHSYQTAGTYTVTFTTTDSSGIQNTSTVTVTVSGSSYNGYGQPVLSYLSPTQGRVGTQIALQGSGFASYGNIVHFGIGGTQNVSSVNGSTIYYTIPYTVSGCDIQSGGNYCSLIAQQIVPGTSYPVSVTTPSGTTSTLYFTVTY
jgi:hypothetical protein